MREDIGDLDRVRVLLKFGLSLSEGYKVVRVLIRLRPLDLRERSEVLAQLSAWNVFGVASIACIEITSYETRFLWSSRFLKSKPFGP